MSKMRSVLLLMLILASCWAGIPNDPILNDINPQFIQDVPGNYRLPTDVEPTAYKITLEPFIDVPNADTNFTFKGSSEISLRVVRETRAITFHAKNLELNSYEVEYTDAKGIPGVIIVENEKEDFEKNFITLFLKSPLETGMKSVTLKLSYSGQINNYLKGFYRSSYLDKNNKRRWLATTQFEPTHAREAFPCWDEPAIKAPFDIIIVHDPNYTAISNTPIKEARTDGGKKRSVFHQTPMMSTYLVAFVISDFEKYDKKDAKFNVWAKPPAIASAKYAYDYGKLILKELDDWTGIKYDSKIAKMDQISIPDFAAGAMENWGLVTYRESALLYTEKKSTTKDKQNIATIIAHEFAHQWFGNLVTPQWWDYIWLNEGFATFFQYYIIDQLQKHENLESWRLMEQFVVNNVQVSSFGIDATTNTRPMNANPSVKTPAQISSLFDTIAYKKAASVIRMTQHFLNETNFQNAIREYLQKYQDPYKSAVTHDELFQIFSSHKKDTVPGYLPVSMIMDNWVNKPGYPVVTAKKNKDKQIVLEQERFFLKKPAQKDDTQWFIPIDYITQDKEVFSKIDWFHPRTTYTLPALEDNKWILLNKDQAGYYRVNYDTGNWKLLAEYLRTNKFQKIRTVNRAQLIDDALNLARAEYLEYPAALDITLYLKQEDDYIPWHAAIRAFDYLDNMLQSAQNYTLYRNYVARNLQHFVDKVDIENVAPDEPHVNKLAKVLALNAACKYGIEKCEKFAERKLTEWLEEKKDEEDNKLWIDYRSGVLCAGLRKADQETWNKTLERYNTSTDKQEKKEILAGLGCATNKIIINTFLELTFEADSVITVFDALDSIRDGNPASIDLLIEFIGNNMERIRGKNNENSALLIKQLDLLARKITNSKQFTDLSLMIHENLRGDQSFEGFNHIMENLAWLRRHQDVITQWISENDPPKEEKGKGKNSANSFTLMSFLVIIPVLLMRL